MSAERVKKSFRIKLSIPIALLLLGLGGISLVAAFYLGLVAGKSLRLPEPGPVVTIPEVAEEPERELDQLRFFNLGKGEQKEELDLDSLKRLTQKTQQLKDKTPEPVEAPRQQAILTTTSTPAPKPAPKPLITPKTPSPPAPVVVELPLPSPPEKPAASKKPAARKKPVKRASEPQYTVQVFAARNKKNSERMVQRLKKNGFQKAYIFKYVTSDKKALYRVRVGRMRKVQADSLAKELKSLEFIDSVQVIRY